MVKLHVFTDDELPDEYKCQVLCFLRIVWPEGFIGENRLRSWITDKGSHPIHFILEENGILISHLEVVWKDLEFENETYKAYGLTGIFTYPAFRNQGYTSKLIEEAQKYIFNRTEADLIIFHSELQDFYEKFDFLPMKEMTTLKGQKTNPEKSSETAFMMFLSDLAKKNKAKFEHGQLFFGEETW